MVIKDLPDVYTMTLEVTYLLLNEHVLNVQHISASSVERVN